VVFFLAAQRGQLDHFAKQAQIVSSTWAGQIETLRHFKDYQYHIDQIKPGDT